jgi:hypothetical protein
MNNYQNTIETLFSRISILHGTLYHLEYALTNYSNFLKKKFEESKEELPDFLLGTKMVICDLTGPTDNGWNYYYPISPNHTVTFSNNDYETKKIINRESSFVFAQGYEAFSVFIKNILVEYFKLNPKEAIDFKIISSDIDIEDINWFITIRELRTGNNNKELFKILHKINPDLSDSEIINNKDLNLKDWYQVISFVRHKITHSNNQVLKTDKDFRNLSKNQKDYFKMFFIVEENNEKLIINLNREICRNNLYLIAEYAFLIFKSLSTKSKYDWKILKNMNK